MTTTSQSLITGGHSQQFTTLTTSFASILTIPPGGALVTAVEFNSYSASSATVDLQFNDGTTEWPRAREKTVDGWGEYVYIPPSPFHIGTGTLEAKASAADRVRVTVYVSPIRTMQR
jgi:hypothetical protein